MSARGFEYDGFFDSFGKEMRPVGLLMWTDDSVLPSSAYSNFKFLLVLPLLYLGENIPHLFPSGLGFLFRISPRSKGPRNSPISHGQQM
jgi:hypothetical protein